MKTILISGGAGYLGTELTKSLIKSYKVIVYDKLYFPWLYKSQKKIKYNKNLSFIKKNISNAKIKDFKNVDIVCDLNGISNDPSSEIDSAHTWEVNYNSRLRFAKMAKESGVSRYIFNSTCSVYGFNKKKVFEKSKKKPLSTYAKANYKAEQKIMLLRNKKFKVNSLRNATLFGFSNTMRLDLVINIFVFNLINKKKIIIDGNGEQFRPFISITDVINIYKLIIGKNLLPSFICNLVSFNSTVSSIAKKICRVLKIKKNLIDFNKKAIDNRNYIVGSKNFKKYFGEKFEYSNFSYEILNLKKNIKKFKIKNNNQTIRMKYYKNKLV